MRLARACVLGALAATALMLAGCSYARKGDNGQAPAGIMSSWDDFYADWIKPVVHVGTPLLIVFVALLTLARVLTRVAVTKNSPGPRGAKLWDRARVSAAYWLGVAALLWSSVEVTVIFPLGRRHPPAGAPPAWVTATSLALVACAGVAVTVLYAVVGRPQRRHIYAPGADVEWRRRARIHGYARVGLASGIAVPLLVAAGLLIVELSTNLLPGFGWLNNVLAPLFYAGLLATLGILVVGRTRGLGMGLLIQGHDKAGNDDGGLGAFVRARLYALGSRGPGGIQVTQQTDVSSLPSEALSLIPEGTLAKLAQVLVKLFTPATPWRIDVTEQSDGSVVVSIQRNATVADAMVIRPTTLGLPAMRTMDPPPPGAPVSAPRAVTGSTDWSIELRTAAAAFILLALARRYYHVHAGLSGAADWRSVALQVIATDPASRLGQDDKKELLARAVAADGGNVAAELALLHRDNRDATKRSDTWRYIGRLEGLLRRVPNDEGMTPLRLRIRFNLMIALANYAALSPLPHGDRPDPPPAGDGSSPRDALERAAAQGRRLLAFWDHADNRREYPALWGDMSDAVVFAAEGVAAEWDRRFRIPMTPGPLRARSEVPTGQHVTLLARYERACTQVARADVSPCGDQHALYDKALDDLEMAVSVRSTKVWAREDPSLLTMHDVERIRACNNSADPGVQAQRTADADVEANAAARTRFDPYAVVERFKSLVGDPVPHLFLDLVPFDGCRAALERYGVRTAAQLVDKTPRADELSVPSRELSRLIEVARLYEWLRDQPTERPTTEGEAPEGDGHEVRATETVFLLLRAGLDSKDRLTQALCSRGVPDLRQRLLRASRSWDLVAPTTTDVGGWERALRRDNA